MTRLHAVLAMDDNEMERGVIDCMEDFVDGVMSDDSSFYGK
jgi:hypothetical protein